MNKAVMALVLGIAVGLAVAQVPELPSPAVSPRSVQHLMLTQIDPALNALRAAISTLSQPGEEPKSSERNDAAWAGALRSAATLVAAAEALGTPGLPVIGPEDEVMAAQGNATAGGDGPSDLALSQEIQKQIDRRPASFARHALRLKQTAQAALAASERRDAAGLVAMGEAINHACEQCHRKYWYP